MHRPAADRSPLPTAFGLTFLLGGIVATGVGGCVRSEDRGSNPSVVKVGANGYQLVRVPGGWFTMGSPEDESGRGQDEARHLVELSRDYYLGMTEVSQAEWVAVMGTNPAEAGTRRWHGGDAVECSLSGVDGSMPVVCVSWIDVVEFCNELTRREGLRPAYRIEGGRVHWDRSADGYRLPTEAEWERAARGPRGGLRYGAVDQEADLCSVANVYDPIAQAQTPGGIDPPVNCRDAFGRLAPTGTYPPNGYGLRSMIGNVWEWTWDAHGDFHEGWALDPSGPDEGDLRSLRGGSWYNGEKTLRVANRYVGHTWGRSHVVGFRVARNAEPGPPITEVAEFEPAPPEPTAVRRSATVSSPGRSAAVGSTAGTTAAASSVVEFASAGPDTGARLPTPAPLAAPPSETPPEPAVPEPTAGSPRLRRLSADDANTVVVVPDPIGSAPVVVTPRLVGRWDGSLSGVPMILRVQEQAEGRLTGSCQYYSPDGGLMMSGKLTGTIDDQGQVRLELSATGVPTVHLAGRINDGVSTIAGEGWQVNR